jgi:hypothetical protein
LHHSNKNKILNDLKTKASAQRDINLLKAHEINLEDLEISAAKRIPVFPSFDRGPATFVTDLPDKMSQSEYLHFAAKGQANA